SAPAGGTVSYTSIVPFTLTETIVLKNSGGQVVRTLVNGVSRPANTYTDVWNGKNDSAGFIPDGPYFYYATVTDGTHSMTWDLTSQAYDSYSNYQYPSVAAFDPFNNNLLSISYNFDQPGRVTLAFSPPGTFTANCNAPRFCTENALYQESGAHTFRWAGVDLTGAFRGDITQLALTISRSAFSANAVVMYGTRPTIANLKVTPAFFGPAVGPQKLEFDLTT